MTTTARRVRALVALRLAEVLAAQRALVPLVLFVVLVVVLVVNDPSPAPGPWPATVPVLAAAGAWLALAATNSGSYREITAAAVGGPLGWVVATVAATLVLGLPAAVLGAVVPAVAHPSGFPPAVVLGALVAHVTALTTGTAIGLACSRPVVDRAGWAATVAFVLVVVVVTTPWLPPVGTTVRAVDAGGWSVADPVVAVAVLAAVAGGWGGVARRRG